MQWTGFVDDSGHFSLDRRREFSEWLQRFRGHEVVVTVQRKTRKRSLEQNAWLWGVALPLIAEHLGYDRHELDDLHYDLLSVRFGTKAVAPRVPGAPPRIVPSRTSADMTTTEFSDYMDWLVRYAAQEFGVVIPLPDDTLRLGP